MIDQKQIKELKDLIKSAKNIVFLTGAGISTPSGIPDIRSNDGLAKSVALERKYGYSYEEIVSHSFFMMKTEEFYRYYKEQMIYKDAKPNEAHKFIKDLEKDHNVTIITQNIDGLHHVAGSKNIIEFHGTVQRNICMNCGEVYGLDIVLNSNGVPHCPHCGGIIKPDVVLFEEPIDRDCIYGSLNALANADALIVIGSSLRVNPAAALCYEYQGNNLVIINKDPTPYDSRARIVINDNIIEVIKELQK